jgi:tRNA(fMet)-specific endonuclease VapC
MRWMLDSNACSRYLNGKSPSLKKKLEDTDEAQIVVCSIVKAEMHYWSASQPESTENAPKDSTVFRSLCLFAVR